MVLADRPPVSSGRGPEAAASVSPAVVWLPEVIAGFVDSSNSQRRFRRKLFASGNMTHQSHSNKLPKKKHPRSHLQNRLMAMRLTRPL